MHLLPLLSVLAAHPPRRIGGWRQAEPVLSRPSTVNCTWHTFAQKLDHFGGVSGTFPQRYCVYDKWWRGATSGNFRAPAGAPGPIFFYTGNESPVEEYINNTGLMWELGEPMGALLIFAEHRYEPLSHPALCGQGTQRCFAYCTTAQALADWAALLAELRAPHSVRAPAVAFGGSYGGMLTGWFRMKHPKVIDGAIAASAPIWQLAPTVTTESLDLPAVAITRGVSAAGGASDQCRDNLRAAWPLLQQAMRSDAGRALLTHAVGACDTLTDAAALLEWAQTPYFYMAEGNYPFPSSYITFSVGPGLHPLPAWPMRAACAHLERDFGLSVVNGSFSDVRYSLTAGELHVTVDWNVSSGNGDHLTSEQLASSGVVELAAAVASAASVWYNVTKDVKCYDIRSHGNGATGANADAAHVDTLAAATHATGKPSATVLRASAPRGSSTSSGRGAPACPVCPPCDACPPCPVSYCDWEDDAPCSYKRTLPKTFSWEGITTNEALSQIDIQGVGRDLYWPPRVERNYSVESVVGPRHLRPSGAAAWYASQGLRGAPLVSDPWSGWLGAYYGGREIAHHRNIVWSNGALDPWSGQGVYPPGGGPDGPLVQNISADGSQIALLLDLGAHHLDLMFSDPRNPPCFHEARKIEERMIRQWCQEAFDAAFDAA